MSDQFDREELEKRIHQEYDAYQTSLKLAENKKEAALLHANYFQDCLKNSMESILQSNEARRIPVKIIVSILKDRTVLSSAKANDAAKICDIRDWFTHRVNVKSVEEDVEALIHTIDMQFPKDENTTHGKEITDITIRASMESIGSIDLYERLDLICSDLSRIARNEALQHLDVNA